MKRDKKSKMGYLIIGNSVACLGAIESIRSRDKDSSITVVSDETYPAYSRPAIAHYLAGEIDEGSMLCRDEDFYKNMNVQTIFGKKAVRLDTKNKIVTLNNREKVHYNRLLIATGGTPFIPPFKGTGKAHILTFTAWDDAKKIREKLDGVKKAVIVGGGLIGLCAAEALERLGVEVIIIELADRILSPALDEKASGILEERLKEEGIKIITQDTVLEITGSRTKVRSVTLKSGKKISCDMVIVAIGVRPNMEIVQGTDIKVDRGILVDDAMQTNIKDVYAAGDVTQSYDSLYGTSRVTPIWPRAYIQGGIAGLNMAGHAQKYPGGFDMNSLVFYDVPIMSVGIHTPREEGFEVLTKCIPEKKIYQKLVLKDGVLKGFIIVGNIENAGILTGLIKEKINVENFKERLMEEDFGFTSFPKELRDKKLKE